MEELLFFTIKFPAILQFQLSHESQLRIPIDDFPVTKPS